MRRRSAAYFEQVLNVADVREEKINDLWTCCGVCIVPLYKGKGDKCECSNSRSISLLGLAGKLFGRVLIKRVRVGTECAIWEEQCGFRQGRGCMDQVFSVRQVCEKYLAKMGKIYSDRYGFGKCR